MRYLYLPFSNYMADRSFTGTVERYKRKGHTVIENSCGWKPLRVLKAGDVLIIMGHGGSGDSSRGQISVKRVDLQGNASYASKTFNDLAAQLESDGLPKSHQVVKSLTCYGGGAAKLDANNDTLTTPTHEYFAQLLAKSLGLRGYASVKVGGYPGTVGSTTDQKKVFFPVLNNSGGKYTVDSDGEYGVPTKGFIQWFDSGGNPTTAP